MKPGRPRKPTAVLEAQGAFEKDPQRRRRLEPQAAGAAEKPAFVKGRAARIWKVYAPLVEKMGLLRSVDAFAFSVWCCLAAEFEEDYKHMPAARITAMRQAGEKFGLDPSARAKLETPAPAPLAGASQQDPAGRYFSLETAKPASRSKQ